MSVRTLDWVSTVAVAVGLGLVVAGVYLGLGLAAGVTALGVVLVVGGVLAAMVVASARQEREP